MNTQHPEPAPTTQPQWARDAHRRTDVHELLRALDAVRTHLGGQR